MNESTKILYVRNMPERLIQKVKAAAALEGLTLKEWMVRAIEKALNWKRL